MCGICGVITCNNTHTDEPTLWQMARTLSHRGPDDEAIRTFSGGGFGFRRLSIIDLAGARQPMANEDHTAWLVCNGEIYNYRELRRHLIGKGHRFRTDGDAEVVLHGYEEWGTDVLTRLRGMFAFALWDGRTQQAFLARDRMGIKPLYYAWQRGQLIFGSELKSVIASDLVPRDIDFTALDCCMSLMYIPAPATCYRHVRKLSPASFMLVRRGTLEISTYWTPPAPVASRSIEDEAGALRETLGEAVKLHLQSDVPLGFFLSGGLDSSSVVALAADAGRRLRTFAIGFDTATHNELPYAREVARRFDCDHTEHMVKPDAAGLAPMLAAQFDEPFGDSSAIPMYHICELAAQSVRVVIGGDGGDELFAGYEWTRRQVFVDRWLRLPRSLRSPLEALLAGHGRGRALQDRLARFIADAAVEPLAGYARRIGCLSPAVKRRVYGPLLQEQLQTDTLHDLLHPFFTGNPHEPLASMNRFDYQVYLPDDDLCKVDRVTMLHSLEGRVPLLDHVVAEQALSLPMHYKLRGGRSKYVLKMAMRKLLPPAILRQRKQGFAIPVHAWMRGPLQRDVSRILLEGRCQAHGLLRRDGMADLLGAHATGRVDYGHVLWTLLMVELWFRFCVDRPTTSVALRGTSLAQL